jgi:Tol biopolymer transport system component/DNA-binding winged helix-turn-helix (wHTH) protein
MIFNDLSLWYSSADLPRYFYLEHEVQPVLAVRFGLYDVDLVHEVVSRQGTRLKLQEQPFRILIMLLQKPGEIVTREELRQTLWGEGTHVNFDGSLNAALKKLRSCLQDDAENPRFIETVPRQGYRFLAPVHQIYARASASNVLVEMPPGAPGTINHSGDVEVHLTMQPDFSPEKAAELQKARHREERAKKWADVGLLAAAILFGSWLLFYIVYPVPRPSVQRMVRITNAGDIDETGGIVSDGARIFFLERFGGRWRLMQTSVEGGNAEVVTAPFPNTRLFAISPDHAQFLIGEFSRPDEEMPLWLWPVQGGAPRRVGEATGRDPAWSPDGSLIVFAHDRSLYTIHPDGTQLREIARPNGKPHALAWAGDGDTIRFHTDTGGGTAIWEMNADGSKLHRFLANLTHPASQSAGQWTADGKYFLFSGCENNECNLWAVREAWNWWRRTHSSPVQLTPGPDSLHVSIPGQTGSRVFAFSLRSHRALKKIDVRSGAATFVVPNIRADEAVISPNGQSLLYVDRPDGSLWLTRMDSNKQLRLTNAPLVVTAPRWSRDGSRILFTGLQSGHNKQIYIQSTDGGALRAVLPEGREGAAADWSPDGTQLVVSMRDVKIQPKLGIYLFKPQTGEFTLLPESRGLAEPRWSPDGRFIAALSEDYRHLVLYDFQTEKWNALAEGGLLGIPYWADDSKSIYFQDQLEKEQSVFRVAAQPGGETRSVFSFNDVLQSPARYVFNGLDAQGSLYVTEERGLTDLYALDLDLP